MCKRIAKRNQSRAKNVLNATNMITLAQEGRKRDISYVEMVVNNLRAQIVKFLWRISAQHLSTQLSKKVFAFTAIAGDIESIGNHVVWITELSTQKAGKKVKFTESGKKELQKSYVW